MSAAGRHSVPGADAGSVEPADDGAHRERPPWWEGMAEVEAAWPAGAESHRLRWATGRLRLDDHADPEGDRTLGALGGDRCPCLDVFDAWEAAHDDAAVLAFAGRRPEEVVLPPRGPEAEHERALTRWRSHLRDLTVQAQACGDTAALRRLTALAEPTENAAARRAGFLRLLWLSPGLQLRLQASVAATLAAAGRLGDLAAPTAGRALPALTALGWSGGLADIDIVPAGAVDGVTVGLDHAVLPASWIAEVWGRGLASVPGVLVLAVLAVAGAADGTSFDILAAAPGKASALLRVDRWDTGWRTT